MVKRGKQTQNCELRSSPVNLSIHKYDLSNIRGAALEHWNLRNIQPYFPPIEKLFKSSELEGVSDYGIRFREEVSAILDANTIRTSSGKTVEVHRKTTMLLSPYKWMRGEYGNTIGLPTSIEQAMDATNKIQSPNNAAYVGAIVSTVLSQSECQHFPKVYGVFTSNASEHTIDISDDYAELSERGWFSNNIGKMFHIKLSDDIQTATEFNHTRSARVAIQLGEVASLENIEELDVPQSEDVEMGSLSKVLHDEEKNEDNESDSSSVSTSYVFGVRSCDCEDDDDSDYDDETGEPFAWATFTNVPVETTVMEKCEGTLYELLMTDPDTQKHLAWISQVMFGLAYAQRTFSLTQNDLHANNVMYTRTDVDYYFYNCGGSLYRVPTYGYSIKLIDFERGIASVKIIGMKEPKLFISDHFCIDEEAGGQYNYADFNISKHKEIKPNPSFDLVRLATSLFWDLFPNGITESNNANLVYKMFVKWLTLEDGTSILFGKKDPKHDRFHGFHLYKAIARYCKDNAVPRREIISNLKEVFGVDTVPEGNSVLLIDP